MNFSVHINDNTKKSSVFIIFDASENLSGIWIFRSWKTTEEITFCGIISSFSNALNTDS